LPASCAGADDEEVIAGLARRWRGASGVVLMHGLAVRVDETTTADGLIAAERFCCSVALLVLKVLIALADASGQPPRAWMVTRAAQSVRASVDRGNPLQACLWGIGRVAAQEQPAAWGGLIDLDEQPDLDALLAELMQNDGEDQVALRAGKRYVARLVPLEPGPRSTGSIPRFGHADTYLIVGGLGALGLKLADWLVRQHHVRRVVLTARRPPDTGAAAAIAAMAATGARILVKAIDITSPADVQALITEIDDEQAPLKGVFHCAGTLGDGILAQMDWEKYALVTASKVVGGWLLHQATRELALDHFIVFSSVLGILGSMGQANYVAANCFLDSLVEYRRRMGLAAQTINWGPWAEDGLATQSGRRGETIWRSRGTRYIEPAEGMDFLQHVVERGSPSAIATFSDWSQWKRQLPQSSRLLELLVRDGAQGPEGATVSRGEAMRQFAAASEGARREVLQKLVERVVAFVLGIDGELNAAQALPELGLDSLMAITLANHLADSFGIRVPLARILQGPTLGQLVDELLPKVVSFLTPDGTRQLESCDGRTP
jgi:short-subunit dehydrogenase/acyl carrier protein